MITGEPRVLPHFTAHSSPPTDRCHVLIGGHRSDTLNDEGSKENDLDILPAMK
jgi:hypothetical protein